MTFTPTHAYGFDGWNASKLSRCGNITINPSVAPNAAYPQIVAGAGRRGGECLKVDHRGLAFFASAAAGAVTEQYFACAQYIEARSTTVAGIGLVKCFSTGTLGALGGCARVYWTAGAGVPVLAFTDNTTNVVVPFASALPIATWYWLEMYFKSSDTVGEVTVRIDGNIMASRTGVDTHTTGIADIAGWGCGEYSGSTTPLATDLLRVDDVLIGTGGYPGNSKVHRVGWTGLGTTHALTPSETVPGTPDAMPGLLTDNVDGTKLTGNGVELLTIENFATMGYTPGVIHGTALDIWGSTTDIGTKSVRSKFRRSGATVNGAASAALPGSTGMKQLIQPTNPTDGTNPFTEATWPDEAGFEVY